VTDPSNGDLLNLRRRLLEDFAFYAEHCIRIRTKEGQIAPLVLNEVQRRFLGDVLDQWRATGRVRMVVLKARQQGLSTVISAFGYWWLSQHSAQKGLVMAHEAESTTTLFDMYQRTHDNVPAWVKPSTKYSSRTELVFKELDSGLRVATAGGRGVARGETLTFQHLSEVGFWPVSFAEANFNGLSQAVPNTDNTFAFIESTANGLTGKFATLWEGAVKGENEFTPFFSGWFESSEYREPVPADFRRSPAEDILAERFNLTNDQLYWRRRKIGSSGQELFQQEYPATPEEAFLSTGRPVFNPEDIYTRLRVVGPPIKRMAVDHGSVNENSLGELFVYREHDPHETYTIGADVGMGIRNGDPSVAQVLDSELRQVAVWRGMIQPDAFATVLNTLGYHYNTATIAVERNNHGLLTCVNLGRNLAYPLVWTEVTEGALEDRDTIQIGLYITERTKPLIIDKLRSALRTKQIEINDQQTLREMLTFVVTDSGRLEAEGKSHDDMVMSLAIANHVHEGAWRPVEVPEGMYVTAI
jgi:hypothetical protein